MSHVLGPFFDYDTSCASYWLWHFLLLSFKLPPAGFLYDCATSSVLLMIVKLSSGLYDYDTSWGFFIS